MGLKLELEAVEAASGAYPVTDGLLSLLTALVGGNKSYAETYIVFSAPPFNF